MTPTKTVKQYGEFAVTAARTHVLVMIGASDLAVERAKTAVSTIRSKAEALPGETQVQVDLAAKEARTRATEAAEQARTAAQQLVTAVRPEVLRSTVAGLVESARTQALTTVKELAEHGAEVVEELRAQPGFRRIVRRAERAVDAVENTLEDVLEETADAVVEASNEVTSIAQKTAAKASKAATKAEEKVEDAAESTKATVEGAADEPKPAKKNSAAAAESQVRATSTVTGAGTARRADPTAVPAKKTTGN